MATSQFVGYHIDGYDTDKSIPIATGATKEEAQAKAIRRVLGACILDGFVSAQERPELSPDDFSRLTEIIDNWAHERGLP